MPIRPATEADFPEILSIYNWAVEKTVATFDTEIKQLPQHETWFGDFKAGYPLAVIEDQGEIAGFGLLKAFSDRQAYSKTCELSVYILPDYHRKGYGSQMMDYLIKEGMKFGQKVILSKIEASSNASIELHKKYGFTMVGTLNQVGYKFDRWLDVAIMQKLLS